MLLNVVAKVDTVHVPYKGAGPALNDLLGAQTQFMVTTIPSVLGMLEGKLLRPLAVTSKERVAVLPEVPTVAESGWPDYESTAWYGFVVPAGTPKEIVETLRKTTVDAINTPLVKQRLEGEGARPIGTRSPGGAQPPGWSHAFSKPESTLMTLTPMSRTA